MYSSFTLFGLALQDRMNAYIQGRYIKLTMIGAYFLNITNIQRKITYSLGATNLNMIKSVVGLCQSSKSCYLSAYSSIVNDTSNNSMSIVGFNIQTALPITIYTVDIIGPTLLYWDFNLVNGDIILTFSESVYVAFMNFTKVLVISQPSTATSTESLRVSNSPSEIKDWTILPPNSDTIHVLLSLSDLSFVKSGNGILRSKNNSYLVLEYNAIVDTSIRRNRYLGQDATPSNAMQVRKIITNSILPQCLRFSMDMTLQTLTLHFSEVIDIQTIVLEALTLQSRSITSATTEVLRFSSTVASVLSTRNDNSVVIKLLSTGFNLIKASQLLGRSPAATFISTISSFALDIFGNAIVEIPATRAMPSTTYTVDTIPPTLLSWSVNLGSNTLTLIFSEPLQSPVDITKIILSSSSSNSSSSFVSQRVSSNSYIIVSTLNVIEIRLGSADSHLIKSRPPLCISKEFCFLSIELGFGKDTSTTSSSNNIVQNMLGLVVYSATNSFVSDTVSPTILSYGFDLNTGALSLQFSETINSVTFNGAGVVFYDSDIVAEPSLRSSQYAYFDPVYTTSLVVHIPLYVLRAITAKLSIGSGNNLYATFQNITVRDMAGNYMTSVVSAMQAAFIVPDSIPPIPIALAWNASVYLLTVYFSESIRLSPITLRELKIFSSSPGLSTTLNGVTLLTSSDSDILMFDISFVAPAIAAIAFGSSQFATNFYITGYGAISDSSLQANPILPMSSTQAVSDGNRIMNFRLHLHSKVIILEFAYPINVKTLDPTQFVFKDSFLLNFYPLTTDSNIYSISPDGYFLTLIISSADYLSMPGRIVIDSHLYAEISRTFIQDNDNKYLSQSNSINCVQIIYAVELPSIIGYNLNLANGIITMFFSKNILTESAQFSTLTLMSSRNVSTSLSVNLEGTYASNNEITQTFVSFIGNGSYPTVRDKIHLSGKIGSSISTTFLTASFGFVTDTLVPSNFMDQIQYTNAIEALFVTQDTILPSLQGFDLNMNSRILSLTFSEAVNGTSAKINLITLRAFAELPLGPKATFYTLKTSIGYGLGTTVYVNLSQADFNDIMLLSPKLAMNSDNTYITLSRFAFRDISYNRNSNKEILLQNAIKVGIFTPDRISPSLLYFDFSLQDAFMTLYFSKIIKCSSFHVDSLSFQYLAFTGVQPYKYTLSLNSSSFSCSASLTNFISVNIGEVDIQNIKIIPFLVKFNINTFLTLPAGFVIDPYENEFIEIGDAYAVQVRNYTGDSIRPKLLYYLMSKTAVLSLVFSEPTDLFLAFDVTAITLYDGLSPNSSFNYRITSSSTIVSISADKTRYDLNILNDYLFIAENSGNHTLFN